VYRHVGTPDVGVCPAAASHSEQPVATEEPGQIGLSPDGRHLVVVAKEGPELTGFPSARPRANGEIDVYGTAPDGTLTSCNRPTAYVLPQNAPNQGKFPFSFAWTKGGQTAVCWIDVSGQNVYTTNYLTNDVSSYTVNNQAVAGRAQSGSLVTPIFH
jgi:6-phosphogluconolactonase (cycloisomerase 2 family)